MSEELGGDWPQRLQSAFFAANTQIKQSTGSHHLDSCLGGTVSQKIC